MAALRWAGRLAAAAALVGFPGLAAATGLTWDILVTPISVTQGLTAEYSATARNVALLPGIRCIRLDLPASFSLLWAEVTSAPLGQPWDAHADTADGRVTLQNRSTVSVLGPGQSVGFRLAAGAATAGIFTWHGRAFERQDCSGSRYAEEVTVVITVVPDLLATPTPTSTPMPTATPTPTPTPTPAPTATPTPTPGPSSTEDPMRSPDASARTDVGGRETPASPGATEEAGGPPVAPTERTGSEPGEQSSPARTDQQSPDWIQVGGDPEAAPALDLGSVDALGGFGTWTVPAGTIAGPGLLVILWVGLQAAGGIAWLPAVRALRGAHDRSRRRGRARAVTSA